MAAKKGDEAAKNASQGRHERPDDDAQNPCAACWPEGWSQVEAQHPGLTVTSVGCAHGIAVRETS